MKKLFGLALALLTLASCSNDDDTPKAAITSSSLSVIIDNETFEIQPTVTLEGKYMHYTLAVDANVYFPETNEVRYALHFEIEEPMGFEVKSCTLTKRSESGAGFTSEGYQWAEDGPGGSFDRSGGYTNSYHPTHTTTADVRFNGHMVSDEAGNLNEQYIKTVFLVKIN